ncbi:MAG: DUF3368 domain-containing protein [Deltaproteobacteria bacterium]|nr:DUF3368 domain-containing protein [Deltaproteobacteria bacterium]
MKDMEIIPNIRPFLDKVVEYGFRINPDLYHKVLQKAGE